MTASSSKPIYGNFQRYYNIRNPDNEQQPASPLDPRLPSILSFLEQHLIQPRAQQPQQPIRSILDIGCNSGKVTLQLAQILAELCVAKWSLKPPERVLGVDIDPSLIEEARYNASIAWSRCKPGKGAEKREVALDRLTESANYFPACFPHMFQHLPAAGAMQETRKRKRANSDPAEGASMAAFRSLQFETAEWLNADLPHDFTPPNQDDELPEPDYHALDQIDRNDKAGYDVVLCLALTKWIHVHHGDVGILRLFARIAECLRPGGILVLERQPWKSYEEARRMGTSTRSKLKHLQLRPDDFEWVLESVGLMPLGRVGDGPGMGFTRHVDAFVKKGELGAAVRATFLGCRTRNDSSGIPWVMRCPRYRPERWVESA